MEATSRIGTKIGRCDWTESNDVEILSPHLITSKLSLNPRIFPTSSY